MSTIFLYLFFYEFKYMRINPNIVHVKILGSKYSYDCFFPEIRGGLVTNKIWPRENARSNTSILYL